MKIIINYCNDINSEKKLKNCWRVFFDVCVYNYFCWWSVWLLFLYFVRKKYDIDIKYLVYLVNLGLVVISSGFLIVFFYIFMFWC